MDEWNGDYHNRVCGAGSVHCGNGSGRMGAE